MCRLLDEIYGIALEALGIVENGIVVYHNRIRLVDELSSDENLDHES